MNINENIPSFLIDMLKEQYGKEQQTIILDGYSKNRKTTFRVNTLKTDSKYIESKLNEANILYKKPDFYKDAFIVENANEDDLKKLDIYEKGEIYLQSLSSMLPPLILSPKKNEDILDMCAAPGGKTTQIAALCKNRANITACEMNLIRLEKLKYNVERQGATCVYIMQKDARKIDDFFSFDNILVDTPCSGSGTLSVQDKNCNKHFTKKLIEKSTLSQIALLRKALKILKPGKELVYSTCSILGCENEDIVRKVLKETNAEIVPIKLDGLEKLPLLPTKISGTICVCPNELYEGFFVAKIKK